jgi:hypothetical protein
MKQKATGGISKPKLGLVLFLRAGGLFFLELVFPFSNPFADLLEIGFSGLPAGSKKIYISSLFDHA